MNDARYVFPTSFAQERLWFLDQLSPGSPLYNLSLSVPLPEPVHVAALEHALREIVRRHETLRTTFTAQDGRPMQVVHATGTVPLEVIDLRARPTDAVEREGARVLREAAERPFDLAVGPLLRGTLLRLSRDQAVLLLVMHHIVSDGWSMEVLHRELGALYAAYVADRPSPLTELPVQYADYAVWQRGQLDGPALDAQRAYWTAQLTGAPPRMDLPSDRPRPLVQSFRGASQSRRLSAELTASLRELGRAEGATPFMVLLAGFQALLSRYTGRSDPVVGTPVANRGRPETEGLIGFFVNTLVLRADLAGRPTLREAVRRARELVLGAYAHQDLPFERLVAALAPERHLSHTPLFQVMFVYQASLGDAPDAAALRELGAEGSPDVDIGTAKFDLTLFVGETDSRLTIHAEYATDLFGHTRMARLLEHYAALLTAGAADPDRPLAELPLLGRAERQRLLGWGTGPAAELVAGVSVPALVAARAALDPDATALVVANVAEGVGGAPVLVSYGELAGRAARLAGTLAGRGVRPAVRTAQAWVQVAADEHEAGAGDGAAPVAVLLERSPALPVALLGVLAAGVPYLPLEPSHPPARLAQAVADSGATVVITTAALVRRLPAALAERAILVDWLGDIDEPNAGPSVAAPLGMTALAAALVALGEHAPGPDTPAYIMYTSGSTGRPKGVVVPHRGIVRLALGTCARWFGADDVVLHLAPVSFDASTLEIWCPLINGGRVVLAPPAMPTPEGLGALIRDHGVTALWLTASLFHQVVEHGPDELRPLRTLISGGDRLSVPHVQRFLREVPTCRVVNGYGPTENTTFTCCHVIDAEEDMTGGVPIGVPIAGTHVYVVDEHLRLAPTGVPGELCVGGAGVALGYLNDPALTAERFVPDPFAAAPGGRLYRTGDTARWREDGVLEFLGRADRQVKVRGFRIELGEIESVLTRRPGVRACAVMARDDHADGKRLVAYVVPASTPAPTTGELRRQLQTELPDYMVPNAFVFLDALPLTATGKVDREALPAPGAERPVLDYAYVAPASDLETTIGRIWQEVLGLERVGVHDNFFDLGGHSLLMVRAHHRIQTAVRGTVPLVELFRHPTVHALATHLGRERAGRRELADVAIDASLVEAETRAERQRQARARRRGPTTYGEAEP